MPALQPIIASSRVLTVIFIYDGSETMHGTGFDKEINDLQKQFGRQMRANDLPFVTLLASWNGQPIDFSVNTPSRIAMVQTADLLPAPAANPPPAAVSIPPPPVPVKLPEPRRVIILTNAPESQVPVSSPVLPAPAPENLGHLTQPNINPLLSPDNSGMPLRSQLHEMNGRSWARHCLPPRFLRCPRRRILPWGLCSRRPGTCFA